MADQLKSTNKQLQSRDRLFGDYCHYESKVHKLQVNQHRSEAQAYARGKGIPKGHERAVEKVRRNSTKLETVNHSFEDAEKQVIMDVRELLGSKYAKTNRIVI
eukprot:Filipodium_phascolosomae@DN2778_c0_g2_i1.p1